MQSEIW